MRGSLDTLVIMRRQSRVKTALEGGIRKNRLSGKMLNFLTLTSAPSTYTSLDSTAISCRSLSLTSHFQTLVKRLQRRYKGLTNWDYLRIRTSEGNGVLHVVTNWRYIPQRILSKEWKSIHKAPIVDIRALYYGRGLKNYLNRYLKNQGRLSYSRNWIAKGWRTVYRTIKTKYFFIFTKSKHFCSPFCLASFIRWLMFTYWDTILDQSLKITVSGYH